jgi:histidyl-tRNA synthetase
MTKVKKARIIPQTLKGFRDFLPEEMRIRNYVLNVCRSVFESYGFEPLETPALEYSETLLGKYGIEADKLIYSFKDKGKRDIGLRYDLTVPVSRVLAQYRQKITLPFKRYQIQKVWRTEKPQRGRYREFIQCDIDTFGVKSPLADAEIIRVIYQVLKKLSFKKFIIRINSRQVLFKLLEEIGLKEPKKQLSTLQSLDKLKRQGKDKVEKELKTKALSDSQIKTLFKKIKEISPDENLEEMFKFLEHFGITSEYYQFDPSMVRGLDYYTGPIFETIVSEPTIGSLTGGGRYDNLISLLGGPNITGTGTTIGFERICDVIKEKNLLPKIAKTSTQVLFINFPGYLGQTIILSEKLRENNVNCTVYLKEIRVDKQLKYANQKGIPWVIFLGPDEIKGKTATLKNMKTGQQKTVSQIKLLEELKEK